MFGSVRRFILMLARRQLQHQIRRRRRPRDGGSAALRNEGDQSANRAHFCREAASFPYRRERPTAVLRLGHADDTASDASARITRRLCLQIIRFFVDDDGVSQDRITPAQLHHFVGNFEMNLARSVGLDVSEITRVAIGRIRCAVLMIGRVEMAAGRLRIRR